MSFGQSLERLAETSVFPSGQVAVRWGQLMRENEALSTQLHNLGASGKLATLGSLGRFHSGVVTRANGFFIVRELPFTEIPRRMHVTHGDLQRIAVVQDAMGVLHKIERVYLKPIIKGPEQLESAFVVRESANRLFDVRASKDDLKALAHNGATAYLRRGETVEYTTSEDSLKGGIPAARSQVKNRKPFWYSLQGVRDAGVRIVVPEHIDRRYVFTFVPASNDGVVIDTLYVYEPHCEPQAALMHIGMNSLLSWYQVELRGRSQHGEGVLKVKLPDYRGVQIWQPDRVDPALLNDAVEAFAKLERIAAGPSLDELGEPKRDAFDVAYLRACGFADPDTTATQLTQELRALAAERVERRLSVVDAKVSRRKATDVSASINVYAARLAAGMPGVPDPRDFMLTDASTRISIDGPVTGELKLGGGLFDTGIVKAGDDIVARTNNAYAAELVRAVLLIDRAIEEIALPSEAELEQVHHRWMEMSKHWHVQFETEFTRVVAGIPDPRTRDAVRLAALRTLKASD